MTCVAKFTHMYNGRLEMEVLHLFEFNVHLNESCNGLKKSVGPRQEGYPGETTTLNQSCRSVDIVYTLFFHFSDCREADRIIKCV